MELVTTQVKNKLREVDVQVCRQEKTNPLKSHHNLQLIKANPSFFDDLEGHSYSTAV